MPSLDRRRPIGIAIGVGLVIALLALGAALFRPTPTGEDARAPARPIAREFLRVDAPVPISAGGRVALAAGAVQAVDAVPFLLAVEPAARGDGARDALVVSVDGRRLEARTAAVDGAAQGVRLDVDADFLQPGRYLIQIDTAGDGPLAIRRYVVEVE